MGRILKELGTVLIPKEAKINKSYGQVYVNNRVPKKNGKSYITKSRIIGKVVFDNDMFINEAFKDYFPREYASHLASLDNTINSLYKYEKIPNLEIGHYALVSTILKRQGITTLLTKHFGEAATNTLMDKVMVAIKTFAKAEGLDLEFVTKASPYSVLNKIYPQDPFDNWDDCAQFAYDIDTLDKHNKLLEQALTSKSVGAFKADLFKHLNDYIKGSFAKASNKDQLDHPYYFFTLSHYTVAKELTDAELIKKGVSKEEFSAPNFNRVHYVSKEMATLWAVNLKDLYGSNLRKSNFSVNSALPLSSPLPLIYFKPVFNEHTTSIEQCLNFAEQLGIEIDGFILEGNYETSLLDECHDRGIAYVLKPEVDNFIHHHLSKMYGSKLHVAPEHSLKQDGLYGINISDPNLPTARDSYGPFSQMLMYFIDSHNPSISLIYDDLEGAKERAYILKSQRQDDEERRSSQNKAGKIKAIESAYSSAISFKDTPESLAIITQEIQAAGMSTILSNLDISAQDKVNLFGLKVISSLLMQTAYRVAQHSIHSFRATPLSKLVADKKGNSPSIAHEYEVTCLVSLLSSIVINSIRLYASEAHVYDFNRLIRSFAEIKATYLPLKDDFEMEYNCGDDMADFLGVFDLSYTDIKDLAKEALLRRFGEKAFTPLIDFNNQSGDKPQEPPQEVVQEVKIPQEVVQEVKRPRGRPPKYAIIKAEPDLKEEPEVVVPKKMGRPKGSLNKTTIARMAAKNQEQMQEQEQEQASPVKVKRPMGRPKGSLNKKTLERLGLLDKVDPAKEKRSRGRPKKQFR